MIMTIGFGRVDDDYDFFDVWDDDYFVYFDLENEREEH